MGKRSEEAGRARGLAGARTSVQVIQCVREDEPLLGLLNPAEGGDAAGIGNRCRSLRSSETRGSCGESPPGEVLNAEPWT